MADPADYDFIVAFYQGDSDWMYMAYREEMKIYDDVIGREEIFQGNWLFKGTCDHCGAAFNHGVLFKHTPSDELVHVGHICAANTIGLPDKAAAARVKAERVSRELQAQVERREQAAGWREENAEIVAWIQGQPDTAHNFLLDMKKALDEWGKLTPGQLRASVKWQERDKARAQEKPRETPATPLEEGRRTMTGVVKSVKWQEGDFGTQLKMLVELLDGNRVWGTVPSAIIPAMDEQALVGKSIVFTGTVKRSGKDEHFGYFSRPAGAKVIRFED